jgi:hypothetical protein
MPAQELIYARMHDLLFETLAGALDTGGGPFSIALGKVWDTGDSSGDNDQKILLFMLTPTSQRWKFPVQGGV